MSEPREIQLFKVIEFIKRIQYTDSPEWNEIIGHLELEAENHQWCQDDNEDLKDSIEILQERIKCNEKSILEAEIFIKEKQTTIEELIDKNDLLCCDNNDLKQKILELEDEIFDLTEEIETYGNKLD